jgi:hypothetical protein
MSLLMLIVFMTVVASVALRFAGGGEVKERDEPIECASCGRPTWSASGYCTKCRRPVPPVEQPPCAEPGGGPPPVVTEERLVPSVALDAENRIAEDAFCSACGYNLRGLLSHLNCPECGTPISRSIFGHLLRFSEPAWLRQLSHGAWWVVAGVLGGIAAGMAGWLLMMLAGFGLPPGVAAAAPVLSVLATLVFVVGVWLLTMPDPARSETERALSARAVARWCAMAAVGTAVLEFAHMPAAGPIVPAAPAIALLLAAHLLFGIVKIVGFAAGFVWLHSLALRFPADGLARQTRIVGWGYVLCAGVAMFLAGGFMVVGAGAGAAPGPAGGLGPGFFVLLAAMCFMGLAALVFGVWAIVLLIQYARAFQRETLRARQHSWRLIPG